MKPVFKLEVNDKDVTALLSSRLMSISFKDEEGNQSDEITLIFAGDFERPKYQDEIKLYIGWEGKKLFYCGLFIIQTSERTKNSITITATGADFTNALKQRRTTSYEKISLKDIAGMVAKRHELKLKSDFEHLMLDHVSQTNESDLSFMRRMGREYGGIFSIKNDTLIFLQKVIDKKKNENLPRFNMDVNECSSVRITHANKTIYNSCQATWHDTKENETQSITVGKGEPILIIKSQYKDAAIAEAKARARLDSANRGIKSGTIETYGQEIYAGGILNLTNFGNDNGEYSILSVQHNFDSNGWKMSISIEN